MYLHLGQNTVIRSGEIVGIFDLDICTVSKATRETLAAGQKNGRVVTVTEELPKSFVLCSERRGRQKRNAPRETFYLAQISSTTLLKRTGFLEGLGKAHTEDQK